MLTAVMETSLICVNIISTAKTEFCISIQYTSNQAKLCMVLLFLHVPLYSTEYFMLSRNGGVCFTFHTYDKITYAYHTRV